VARRHGTIIQSISRHAGTALLIVIASSTTPVRQTREQAAAVALTVAFLSGIVSDRLYIGVIIVIYFPSHIICCYHYVVNKDEYIIQL